MIEARIEQAYGAICLPSDMAARLQAKIEAELGRPMSECRVSVRPRQKIAPQLLAAAAVFVLLIGGSALLIGPQFYAHYLKSMHSAAEAPAEQGGVEIVKNEAPEGFLYEPEEVPPEEPQPTQPPAQELPAEWELAEEPEPAPEPAPAPEPEPAPTPGYALGAVIAEGTCGADLTWKLDENGLLLISGTGPMDETSEFYYEHGINGYGQPVLPWTEHFRNIKTLVVEPGVTSIADYAFSDCAAMTSATIPESIKTIGFQAFYNCPALESISIPEGVEEIEDWAFGDCRALKEVTVPGTVKSIGKQAFKNCKALESITLSYGLESIGEYAFQSCPSLTSVTIPGSVKTLASHMFFYGTGLTELTLGEGVTELGQNCIRGCGDLTKVSIPSSVRRIDWTAFADCVSLSDVYYAGTEEQWAQIDGSKDALNLNRAEIHCEAEMPEPTPTPEPEPVSDPDPITASDYELGEIVDQGSCGDNLTWTLDENGLLLISGTGDMEMYLMHQFSYFAPESYERITTYTQELQRHWSAYGDRIETLIVESGVTSVGEFAFNGLPALKEVRISGSVKTIGFSAFSDCGSLEILRIPNGTERIEEEAFHQCAALRSVTIPGSVKTVGKRAFADCGALEAVQLNDGVEKLEEYAFGYCHSLREVTIPGSMKTVGANAFFSCRGLRSVTCSEGVTTISADAFTSCTGLSSISLPVSLTQIEHDAFLGCTGLEDVYYAGSEEQWAQIEIGPENSWLLDATIHFNSEG